jgi:hypothetical protein
MRVPEEFVYGGNEFLLLGRHMEMHCWMDAPESESCTECRQIPRAALQVFSPGQFSSRANRKLFRSCRVISLPKTLLMIFFMRH